MRFIRKNGRVIPIRERISKGMEKGAIPGAAVIGALWANGNRLMGRRFNVVGTGFWALKGAAAGATVGGTIATAGGATGKKFSRDGEKRAKVAFTTALGLSTIGSAARIARAFSKSPLAKSVTSAAHVIGAATGTATPFVVAATAKKGERGRVLVAGASGDLIGANLLRVGGPIARNRQRLGLKRRFL